MVKWEALPWSMILISYSHNFRGREEEKMRTEQNLKLFGLTWHIINRRRITKKQVFLSLIEAVECWFFPLFICCDILFSNCAAAFLWAMFLFFSIMPWYIWSEKNLTTKYNLLLNKSQLFTWCVYKYHVVLINVLMSNFHAGQNSNKIGQDKYFDEISQWWHTQGN